MQKMRSFENRSVLKRVIVISLITLITLVHWGEVQALRNLNIGDPYPQFCGEQLDGQDVCSSEFKDNVVIASFIRLGQSQSHKVMLALQELLPNYNGKGVSIIVFVSGEVDLRDLMAFKERHKLTYPIILDKNRKIYAQYGVSAYPSTILAGRDKKIHYLFGSAMINFKRRLDGSTRYLLDEINEEELERIVHPVRESVDTETVRSQRYYNGAKKYFDRKQYAKAKKFIQISLKEYPEHALSFSLYGYILIQEKEYKLALEQFEKALKLNPDLEAAKTGKQICLDKQGSL